ncbi:phage tail tape measure protein [Pseudomonas monteilii]|uniref:phage tail tape measure protein n=1 Tax=Pseudomonas monteilii TaxID=76759 RepID=UPI001E52FC05|nr:phage tail tape measure protein [Pseudomonas monteilii]WJN89831.1 phage tail tape measure protein [Pseudomonas monteilii]
MADTDIQGMLVRIEATTAQLRQEMARADSAVSQTSGAIDNSLKQVDAAFDRVEANSIALREGVSRAFTGIGLAAAGAVAGLVALTTSTLNYAQEVQSQSRLANASVEEFQRLAVGAKTVGIEQEKLADIYKDTTDRVGEFISRGGGELQDFFREIAPQVGVTAESFKNLSGPEALQLYYTSLEKAGASQQQITSYMEQMADEATALVPLLKNAGAGFREAGDGAEATGAIISAFDIGQMVKLNKSVHDLENSWDGATRQLVVGLLPGIESVTNKLQGMTDNGVSEALGTAIAFLADNVNILLGVIGTKLTASFIGYVAALGNGIGSTVEATRATNARAQAALMAAKADQIAATSAVVRAEKEAAAARGTAVQTAMSIELAQARMAEAAATTRLGVAQAAVKSSSGVLMTLLGGPAGLAALAVGAGIAFLTMGSNAQSAGADLEELKRPIEELRKAFRELDKDQRNAKLVTAMREQEQAAAAADESFKDFLSTVKRGVGSTVGTRLSGEADEARKAGLGLSDWLDDLDKRFKIPQEAMRSMREAAGGYSSLADNAKKAGERVSVYTKELKSAKETTDAAGDADAKATSAGQTYLDTLDKQLATLKDKTAAEAAERFITDNKIKSESDLAKQIRERAKAVDAQKEADKAAKAETKDTTSAQSKLTQQLKEAETAYQQLKKVYDPVGAAADEFKKQTQSLDLLLTQKKITTEEYGRAIAALAGQFNQAVQASTGLSQAMKYQADLERQLAIAQQQGDAEAAAVGMGDKRSSRAQSRLALEQENNNKILALRDELATATNEKQRQELEKQIALRQEYGAKLVQVQEDTFTKIDAAQSDWSNGASAAFENYLDSAADVAGQTEDLFTNSFNNLEDGIVQFIKTGKASFKDFADSIIEDLIRIQVRQAAAGFLGSAFSFLSGGSSALGQGTMTGFSEVIPNAKGGVYDSPSLSAFSGGVYDSPQMFAFAKGAGIFAEAGPEAIMPLARGPDGSLGVVSMGAGGSSGDQAPITLGNITQHFHFSGGTDGVTKEDLERSTRKGIEGAYQTMLRDFKTNGPGRQLLSKK